MLQLARKADYGLRLMIDVGTSPGGRTTTVEVARRQEIPFQFLRKVAQVLVAGGLLRSERGTSGGLSLARSADAITALDIVRAFEPLSLNCCTVDPPLCERRHACAVYPVWLEAQREAERVLRSATLSSLVRRQKSLACASDRLAVRRAGPSKAEAAV